MLLANIPSSAQNHKAACIELSYFFPTKTLLESKLNFPEIWPVNLVLLEMDLNEDLPSHGLTNSLLYTLAVSLWTY